VHQATNRMRGMTLLESVTALIILATLSAVFVTLGASLMDTRRATVTETDLSRIYTAIVGDPKLNTYGYLGDVGDYPSSLADLVSPSSVPAGWNGPYLSEARLEANVLYDSFGSPIEYFQPGPGALPASPTDGLALISRGPDRNSTDIAGNPNQRSAFAGVLPSDAAYVSADGNADNVVWPHFTDNVKLLDYQSLGHLSINILSFDDAPAVSSWLPACPNYYDVVLVSLPRNANEAYVNYNPGGASFDLLQGLYVLKVFTSGSTTPIWQEQIAIRPGNSVNRNVSLPGVNSSLSATVQLRFFNDLADPLQFYQGATSLGTVNAGSNNNMAPFSANRCSRIIVQDTSTNLLADAYIQPYAPSPINRRYNTNATCSMTFANQSYNTVAIYSDSLLIGTVGKRGNKRAKSFTVRQGDQLTFKNQQNSPISSTSVGASYTVVCPSPQTAQF
jgi:type II secretory pathway pseudopilin PulG